MPDVLPLPDTSDLQLELGAPIPGEDDAWTAYNMLKDERAAGKPMAPDIRTKAVQTWTTYRDTAKRFNRQLFPKQVAPMLDQRKKWQDGLLSGLDQLPQHLTPEQNKALTTRLNIFPEAARPEEIARTANYALLSATVGQKIKPEAWPAFRTAYAKNVLKITDTTDTGVYTELKRRNDVKLDADKNLSGDLEILYPQAIAGAKIDMKAHGDHYRKLFPPEIAQAAEFELRTQLNTARNQGKRVRPIAEALLKFTLQESFRQELVTPPAPGDAPIPGTLGEAARRFEDLSEADKTATAIYLNQKLRNLPPDQASLAERFAEAMANTAIEGGRSALNFVNRAALDAAGGTTKDQQTWQQWLNASGYLRGKAAKIREIVQPTDTWGKLSLLAAGEQLPYMIAAAGGPVGMALNGLGMAGQSYEQARQRNPEGNDLAQFTAAAASGFTQSALETQATKITGRAIGALPGLRSTFGAKFGTESFLKLAGIQNNLLRAATGGAITAGLVGVTEYGEEWAQESADRTLQDIASIATGVTDDTGAPSTMFKNLKTVTQSWDPRTEKGSKMLLALLPFIIIGGGGGGFASFKNGHILKENAAAMEALGVPAPVINEIVTTPDITKAESLLKQAFQVEQIEIDKGKASVLSDWIDDKENALKQLGISLVVPEMNDFTEEEQYRVNFPDGPKYFNTLEESHTAIYEKTRELENTYIESGREAITTDTVNFLMEPGQRAAQGDFRVKENDFQGTIPELLKRGMVTKEQVLSRAEAMAYQLGITQSDALAQMNSGKVRISAQNFIEQVGKKANRYVINLFQGADPINAIEDFAEAFWKAGEFEGLFKPEQAIGWIRETEDSTGNSYLPKDFTWENGGENMAFWEALGQLSRQHALGNHDHISMPKGFKQWIEMMLMIAGQAWEWFKDLTQGKELQEAINNGMLNKKFVGMLSDSIGLNEKMRDQRVIEEETANARADFMEEFPALTDRIKGKLLHPARAWQDGNPLAGELQKIYDELVVTHKKISKSGRRTWQKYNIAAENFFAPRTESVNMSDLFQTMQGEGFTFDSIAEMLDAVEDAMFYGKESYATHGGLAANQIAAGYRQSFSLSTDPANPLNPSDSRYLELAKDPETNREALQAMVDEVAKAAGYLPHSDFRDGHTAPASQGTDAEVLNGDADASLVQVANGIHIQPKDYFHPINGPRYYMYDNKNGKESLASLLKAFEKIKKGKPTTLTVYRAVPIDITATKIENKDWVTPSKLYAVQHGESRFGEGEYRIIKENVPAKQIFWDGNDINEWGKHDGGNRYYKNTPNNIKSADPVTYDESGNVIPLSQRFDSTKNSISFSLSRDTSTQDSAYLAAAQSGDMVTAQRLVDEAAKAAGYDVGPVWHGTPTAKKQTVYEIVRDAKEGLTTADFPFDEFSENYKTEPGIFFHDSQRTAKLYAKGTGTVGRFFLNGVKPRRRLGDGNEYVATNPNQIKSADPITRDNQGNIIPLSQRFDSTKNSISFSLSVANDNGDTVSSVTIPKPFGMNDSNVVSIRADVATGDMPTRADTKRNSSFSISRQQEIYNEAEKKLQDAISLEETAKFSWLSNNNYRTDEIGKKLLDRFRQLNKEYTQPVPGVKFNYRGREAYVSDDGERIVYGPGKWDSDPINWLEVSYTKWLVYQEAVAELQNAEADLYIASIDYDPAREIAQKQFESEHQTLRLQFIDSRAAQFAAALDSAYGPTYTEKDAARLIWQTYAKNDDLFQYGKTTSKDAEDIATAVSIPRSPITATVQGSSIVYTSKEGSLTIHDANKKRPYIRSTEANSQGKEDGGGSQLYTAALDWIHNNEKKIKDDSGLSEINAIRRTSIFFASAIRWGTAKHLMPHANQGVAGWGKNDNTNISLLAIKEMENVHARAPKSKELTFDFKTGKVTAADESEYSRAEIRDIAISHDPVTSAIGTTTLLRGIITASALQELQSGTFATALGVSAPNTRPNSVRGVSYSLSRDTSTSLEALIEARMNRGPEERVRMLETMRTRLQAIVAKLEDRRDGLLSPMEKQLLGWRGTGDLTPEQRERLRIEDAMAGVKGVINALPVEIRSKVAIPITRILDADTDLKTTNAFRELIQNADNVIEEFLQESYTERIANILDTARPTSTESRQNKTLLTPDTQRQIDAIDEIIQMEEVQVIAAEAEAEAKIIALQDQIDAIDQADPDHDTKARALTRQQIEFVQRLDQIHTFGSLGKASSPELANAFEKLQRLYTTGRYARQSIDQAAREQLRASRQDIKEAVGRPDGVTGPEHSRATSKTWWGGLKESAKAYALEHLNFHEILETLFPNSITAQQWSKKAIAAMRGTKRRRLAASDRFNAFMADRFGATTTLQRGRLLDELSQKKDLPVRIREAGKPRMEKVPIEMVPRILNGQLPQSWSNDFIAMEQLRQQWRDYQLAPKKSRSRIQQLKIQFIETWKPADNLHLSQLEILDVLMTYAQEGYRPSLHNYGFNDTAIAELQAILDPRTKEIHAWLQSEYDTGWAELNPVYQSLFNMDMPRIRNYAPGTFENFTNSSGQQTSGNPLGGEQGNATAMSAGFSKNRRAHLARPQAMNALSKFWAHHEQTSYWIEWAELVRDISNVLREPETRRAIEATHGKKLANDLAQWLDRLNTDGASAARERIETTALLERIISTNSALALSWNLGVPFKQFSAAFGSMVFVPANEAIRAFARLMTRPETFAHIWKQEAIQQRIKEGFSPEDRAAMDAEKFNAEKITPNHLTEMNAAGRLPISYTDAAFTTISAAIAYDYHYTAAIRAGMAPELAEREALQYMDMVTARTAQPADTQMRSLAELNARGAGKLLMMFKSDPRRAMGAVIAAAWKAQRSKSPADAMQFARVFTTQWALYGILAQLGGTIFKNLTTDSDDDDDPQPFIDWKAYAVAALLGPIEGFFLFGAIANALKKVLGVKVYTSSMNPLDDYIGRGINALKKDDATAWEMLSGQGLLNAVGMFGGAANRPEAALLPILARASRQALGAMDNLITTEEEQQKRIIRDTREAYTNDRDMRADGLDATVEKALALPLAERDALILTLDEKDRRKARAKIAEKEKQKSMTDPEKMLAKLPTGPREVAAAEIHKTITDPAARAQHAARMKELFDIEFQN